MNKKYELTDECINIYGRKLYRIKALVDFSYVKSGDLGGYVESYNNLSQEGECWIYDDAIVYGNAALYDNAIVYRKARVSGNAILYDNARVYGEALVCDNAIVYGEAIVSGNAILCDNAIVYEKARVSGNAILYDDARVYGEAIVCGDARISYFSSISTNSDYITIGPIGSRNDFITFYKCSDGLIRVNCGCFNGNIDEFLNKVSKTHGNSKYAKEYKAACALATIHIE